MPVDSSCLDRELRQFRDSRGFPISFPCRPPVKAPTSTVSVCNRQARIPRKLPPCRNHLTNRSLQAEPILAVSPMPTHPVKHRCKGVTAVATPQPPSRVRFSERGLVSRPPRYQSAPSAISLTAESRATRRRSCRLAGPVRCRSTHRPLPCRA